jgi:CspA family cold shock protein
MDNVADVLDVSVQDHEVVVVEEEPQSCQSYGKYVGQCKWFNDTYGYGFITVCDGGEKGKDVFVHHTGIKPLNSNYRTLKKGEYLTFDLEAGAKGLQAVNVRGINGGPLMCDCMASTKPNFYNHGTFTDFPLSYPFPQTQRPQRQTWTSPHHQESITQHEIDSPHAPRPLKGKLASVPPQMYAQGQWLVMTKSGRVKNIAKYSKEGRTAMKQAKQNGFVPPYRKNFQKQDSLSNDNTSTST